MTRSTAIAPLCLCLTLTLAASEPTDHGIDPALRPALEHVTADSLRGHLSFIASDLLAGRDTPSPGLDLAAEYIAAQFRRAGLEPAGDQEYFQTTTLEVTQRTAGEFTLELTVDDDRVQITPRSVSLVMDSPVEIAAAAVVRLGPDVDPDDLDTDKLEDAVVLADASSLDANDRDARRRAFRLLRRLSGAGVAMVLLIDGSTETGAGLEGARMGPGGPRFGVDAPVLRLHGRELERIVSRLPIGHTDATVTASLPALKPRPVTVKNVVGMLRGSDPTLSATCVLVSAHYDHIGTGPAEDGDTVFNGANDDGSGTVALIEIAAALARSTQPPPRSIVFAAFFGEERGLLGSRHYAENPVMPLRSTIANINLEHVGRTDDSEEPRAGRAMLTGHGYSTVTEIVQQAADATGVELFHHPRNCDLFFPRSDNATFARAGVPAHTLCTAFIFPDYHGRGDHWDLVDYDNLATISRMVTITLWRLANLEEAPRWNRDHRRTGSYVEAWNELHGR